MSTMAYPEQVPPTVLAHVMACTECESERRPRMFVCTYHEGWRDGWDAAPSSSEGVGPDIIWPHRAVGGNEANQMDRIHGCCAICLVPWPCPAQVDLDEAVLTAVHADLDKWRSEMRGLGWASGAAPYEEENKHG